MHRIRDFLHRRVFGALSRFDPQLQGWMLRRYFDWWHRRPDPWQLATNEDERQKYKATLSALPDRRFRRVLDVGCSEGTFTHLIAAAYPEADVIGVDLSTRALGRARMNGERARFFAMNILEESPPGRFDLVICSEMLYYLGRTNRLDAAAVRLREVLEPGGVLVAVHPWPDAERLHEPLESDPQLVKWSEQVGKAGDQTFQISVYQLSAEDEQPLPSSVAESTSEPGSVA